MQQLPSAMAASLCLSASPFTLHQRPSKAYTPPLNAYNASRVAFPSINFSRLSLVRGALNLGRWQMTKGLKLRKRFVVRMAPEGERMVRRNPLDFPSEWDKPRSPRRADIFPQFSPMKTPLPPPMPSDPPFEEEEVEEQEQEQLPFDDDQYEM